MDLRASTAIGKEKLSILFFHSFYAKVYFNKNQYQLQVFASSMNERDLTYLRGHILIKLFFKMTFV